MTKSLICFLLLIIVSGNSDAQVKELLGPYSCESNIQTISTLHQMAGDKGFVIAIARLGDGERSREYNRRRLHNVRAYLEIGWKRDLKTIVLAEGERVRGYGRVEIYVLGGFSQALAVETNKDLAVGSCEPDSIRPKGFDANFYPDLDEVKRKSRKGRTYRRRKPNNSFNRSARQHFFHHYLLR